MKNLKIIQNAYLKKYYKKEDVTANYRTLPITNVT